MLLLTNLLPGVSLVLGFELAVVTVCLTVLDERTPILVSVQCVWVAYNIEAVPGPRDGYVHSSVVRDKPKRAFLRAPYAWKYNDVLFSALKGVDCVDLHVFLSSVDITVVGQQFVNFLFKQSHLTFVRRYNADLAFHCINCSLPAELKFLWRLFLGREWVAEGVALLIVLLGDENDELLD